MEKIITPAEIELYQLLSSDPYFDFILFPEKITATNATFRHITSGDLIGKDKKYYLLAAIAIARFHHRSKDIKLQDLKVDKKYYSDSLKNTIDYAIGLKFILPNSIKELESTLDLVDTCQYLVHDDFWPKNVLVDFESIKIIDWENMKYGFAESDIARFICDLNCDNPQVGKLYYPSIWHDEIKNKYLDTRHELDNNYDRQLGDKLIRLGEMWNYLGPIEMSLKNNDINNAWFKANLKSLENA